MRRIVGLALILWAASAASAGATTVTLGQPALSDPNSTVLECNSNCDGGTVTELQTVIPGRMTAAPGPGRVTAWRVIGNVTDPAYLKLTVASVTGTTATSRALSGAATKVGGAAPNPVDLPIATGDVVGVTLCGCGTLGGAQVTDDRSAGPQTLEFNDNLGFTDANQTLSGGTAVGSLLLEFNATVVLAPVPNALSANAGSVHGGTPVVISGADLDGATAVSFGGTPATSYTVDSASQITAVAPPGTAGAVGVSVTGPGGTSGPTDALRFTYLSDTPTVAAISPSHGPAAGGTQVTVTGTNLNGASAVAFGTAASTLFAVDSATTLRAAVPPGGAGATVPVTVTTASGISAAGPAFTYDRPADRTAPKLTALALSKRTILFTVSEAATVRFKVERKTRGNKVRGRCRAKAKRGAKPCTRLVVVGKPFSVNAKQGANSAKLPKRLARGKYVLAATPKDAAGNAGKLKTTAFKRT